MGFKGEFGWISRRFRPQLPRAALGCALTTLSGVLATCDPLLMRTLLDSALPRKQVGMALELIAALGVILVLRSLFVSLGLYINFRASQEFSKALRLEVLSRMMGLSAGYHERTPTGEKVSRLEKDVDQISTLYADSASAGVRVVVLFVLNCAAMLMLSPVIGAVLVVLIPAFLIVRRRFRIRIQARADEVQGYLANVTTALCELLPGIPQLQLLGAERRGQQRAMNAWTELYRGQQRQRRTEVVYSTIIAGIITIAMAGTLACGSLQVVRGSLTIGGLVALYAYVSRIFDPVTVAMDLYARLQRAGASVRRVKEVLDMTPAVPDDGTGTVPQAAQPPDLEVRHVHYGYLPSRSVLRDVSLRLSPGEKMVVTGKSGSGKSTLARMLVRFADPQRGALLMAGRPMPEYSIQELRRNICYVPQHPVLFSGTVRENLLYGNERASDEDLERVMDAVRFTPVLARLPEGPESEVGPSANTLSGGEMQRLALARALLRNSPILILDESTSALDVLTEREVLQGIAAHRRGATLIIISHRLSSLTWADRLIVLADGKVLEDSAGTLGIGSAPYGAMEIPMAGAGD